MIQECLRILRSGSHEEMFEIIPRLGVVRDPRFHPPLIALLRDKDPKRREFAAYSMGAIGDKNFLTPLKKAFGEARALRGAAAEDLQVAIIEAIGVLGDDEAVEFFLPILRPAAGRPPVKVARWIVESLGAIAQQGGPRSLEALLDLARQGNPEVRAQAISELSVAYWHKPQHVPAATLDCICRLTHDPDPTVSESAVAALQSLADVGCQRAEKLF